MNTPWVIAYDEVRSGTLIRTAQRKDQPARGRVLVSELVVDDRTVRATIEVSFASEPLLDMLVPVAMRERYEGKKTDPSSRGGRRTAAFDVSSRSAPPPVRAVIG